MSDIIGSIKRLADETGESIEGGRFPERLLLEGGAVGGVAGYLEEKGLRRVLLVADENTFEAAGGALQRDLQAKGAAVELTIVKANGLGDVVADEASVVQTLLDVQRTHADVLLAVGAGTLHDIVRYAAYTSGRPFVSVPTAPSVDGFTSVGAPLLIRGDKITVPAVGPDAIFADIDMMSRAPSSMLAAGFGDMLGKYTSLFDWRFGAATGGEPYSPLAAAITERALATCAAHAADIGRGTEAGVDALARALIESGLAMLIFGQSHPASGAEHHLSHYWEMEFLRTGRRQLLHGAKVGVACTLISERYRRIADEGADRYGDANGAEVRRWIEDIPDPAVLRALLAEAGAPATPEHLGVEPELVAAGLERAHRIRPNRFTLLKWHNERKAVL